MSEKKKDRPWDGRSRIPTQQYKDNYNEIFTKEKTTTKNSSKPNNTSKKFGVSANIEVSAEVVNGTCPHCKRETVLVSLWTNYVYRCMTCGYDLRQKVNGKIAYIPEIKDPKKFRYGLKVDLPNG